MSEYLNSVALDNINGPYRKYSILGFLNSDGRCDNKENKLVLKDKNGKVLYSGTIKKCLLGESLGYLKTREIYGFENYHNFKEPMVIIMNQE